MPLFPAEALGFCLAQFSINRLTSCNLRLRCCVSLVATAIAATVRVRLQGYNAAVPVAIVSFICGAIGVSHALRHSPLLPAREAPPAAPTVFSEADDEAAKKAKEQNARPTKRRGALRVMATAPVLFVALVAALGPLFADRVVPHNAFPMRCAGGALDRISQEAVAAADAARTGDGGDMAKDSAAEEDAEWGAMSESAKAARKLATGGDDDDEAVNAKPVDRSVSRTLVPLSDSAQFLNSVHSAAMHLILPASFAVVAALVGASTYASSSSLDAALFATRRARLTPPGQRLVCWTAHAADAVVVGVLVLLVVSDYANEVNLGGAPGESSESVEVDGLDDGEPRGALTFFNSDSNGNLIVFPTFAREDAMLVALGAALFVGATARLLLSSLLSSPVQKQLAAMSPAPAMATLLRLRLALDKAEGAALVAAAAAVGLAAREWQPAGGDGTEAPAGWSTSQAVSAPCAFRAVVRPAAVKFGVSVAVAIAAAAVAGVAVRRVAVELQAREVSNRKKEEQAAKHAEEVK